MKAKNIKEVSDWLVEEWQKRDSEGLKYEGPLNNMTLYQNDVEHVVWILMRLQIRLLQEEGKGNG